MRILVVEDDTLVADAIKRGLEQVGYAVDAVGSGEQGEQALRLEHFDLAVVDIELPRMDGLELIRRVRSAGRMMPILILTARDRIEDRVEGLELGGDDYVVKPFAMAELATRCRVLIRRSRSIVVDEISLGPLRLDLRARRAWAAELALQLTPREWSVLEMLVLHAGEVVGKKRLMETITGWDRDLGPNAVETYVSRLRAKIEGSGTRIATVRGLGYRLDEHLD